MVRFNESVRRFILDKMSEGNDIAQICHKWPDKVPHPKTIYRRGCDDPKFAEELDRAYTVLLMHRMDELHALSGKLASEVYPDADWREAEAALKRRIDEAKFVLGKMAPVLSKRFNKIEHVEVSGTGLAPQINIISYLNQGQNRVENALNDIKTVAIQDNSALLVGQLSAIELGDEAIDE